MNNTTYKKCQPVPDSFQAFLVEGASFTPTEEYPIIPSWMVASTPPVKIMPLNKALTYRGDLSDIFVCTYEKDDSFERVRRNPKRYVSFFKRTAGLIGFDYSIHTDMPIVKQKSQINDNLSLTYFYGAQKIPIIPNLRCGIDKLLPEFLLSIPKDLPVAIGTYGFFKYKFERYNWYCFLEKVLSELTPSAVIVYGDLNDPIFDSLKAETDFFFYTPWLYEDILRREAKKNVD